MRPEVPRLQLGRKLRAGLTPDVNERGLVANEGTDMTGAQSRRARYRDQTGAAAVEFALVVPLMVMLLLGIITFGVAYTQSVALNNTAREGARFGASAQNTPTWAADVGTQVKALYFDTTHDFGSQSGDKICAALVKVGTSTPLKISGGCSTSDSGYPATPATSATATCVVKVWIHQDVVLLWGLGSATTRISAQSVALYDRTQSCT